MTRLADMTGQSFGILVVLARGQNAPSSRQAQWLCHCGCGREVVINGSNLRRGRTQSCGCERIKHGMANKAPEYHVWEGIKQRCLNPDRVGYEYWGGRGITVCQRWMEFENFYADMGSRPGPGYSIERVDNDPAVPPPPVAAALDRVEAVVLCPGCLHDGVLELTLERAEAAEAKLAAIESHCRGHLQLSGICCPHLAHEILAIISSEEEN